MIVTKRGLSWDTARARWDEIEPGHHIIDRNVVLWEVIDVRDGALLVRRFTGDQPQIWPAQAPDREVRLALLHPADPVEMLMDKLGALPLQFKRNAEDYWICPEWPEELPGNYPVTVFLAHIKELHGIRPPSTLEWPDLVRWHTEHHAEGITHPVKHIHKSRRTI